MGRRAPVVGAPEAGAVPWWGVLAAAVAPILLVAGWSLAAARQPPSYDPRTDTLSALAAEGATARWAMTLAFVGIGICYVLSAFALRQPALPGRIALATGGVATILVAAFPEPSGGTSDKHGAAAAIASSAVAVWPALGVRRDPRTLWVLRPAVSFTVTVVMIGLLAWFASELQSGMLAGLWERVAAGAEALWVAVAVVTLHRAAG